MGLWDDLKGLASEINNSQFMSDMKEMMNNAVREMNEIGEEKTDIQRFNNELNRLVTERKIVDGNSIEAIDATLEALRLVGAHEKPKTTLGKYYALLIEREPQRRAPLASDTCGKNCIIDRSLCEECISLKKQAKEAIAMINNPEAYKAKYTLGNQEEDEELICKFCGAPMEADEQICEYCGTRKSGFKPIQIKVNSFGEIPSAVEYATKAACAYRIFVMKQILDYTYRTSQVLTEIGVRSAMSSADGISLHAALANVREGETGRRLKQGLDLTLSEMSESDVYRAASHVNLPVDVYLRTYMDGDVLNWAGLQYEDACKAQDKQRQEQHEKNMELQRQTYDRQKKANDEFWERQRAMYRPPQYSGGGGGGSSSGGRCCGGCALYNTNSATCARNGYHRTATESCAWFQWK